MNTIKGQGTCGCKGNESIGNVLGINICLGAA